MTGSSNISLHSVCRSETPTASRGSGLKMTLSPLSYQSLLITLDIAMHSQLQLAVLLFKHSLFCRISFCSFTLFFATSLLLHFFLFLPFEKNWCQARSSHTLIQVPPLCGYTAVIVTYNRAAQKNSLWLYLDSASFFSVLECDRLSICYPGCKRTWQNTGKYKQLFTDLYFSAS